MSDSNYAVVSRAHKQIDLIDPEWEQDILSDDGKLLTSCLVVH
jgi:hypothetical protein